MILLRCYLFQLIVFFKTENDFSAQLTEQLLVFKQYFRMWIYIHIENIV